MKTGLPGSFAGVFPVFEPKAGPAPLWEQDPPMFVSHSGCFRKMFPKNYFLGVISQKIGQQCASYLMPSRSDLNAWQLTVLQTVETT